MRSVMWAGTQALHAHDLLVPVDVGQVIHFLRRQVGHS